MFNMTLDELNQIHNERREKALKVEVELQEILKDLLELVK